MRNTFAHQHKQFLAVFFIFLLSSGALAAPIPPDKMKPEDVVAKHLASIGTPEALAAVKSRVMIGNSNALLKLTNTPVELSGPGELASEGEKVLLAMAFNSNNYPFEKAAYNGDKLTIGVLQAGGRSPLGAFLGQHDVIFKQGLIGGVLSSAWPLLNLSSKNPKLSYAGTDKINDRQVHELKYSPRSGGNVQISLFFDAETFQHLRTEYKVTVDAGMVARPAGDVRATPGSQQSMSRYKLVEDFSDFKKEGDLTLPHTYKIRLTIDTQVRTQTLDWVMNFSQFAFNQQIGAENFIITKDN